MFDMVQRAALLLLLLVCLVAEPSAADRETLQQHIASGLAFKDAQRWDDSIGEFRKVLTMRSSADATIWAEATNGMNALCHGQLVCLPTDVCPVRPGLFAALTRILVPGCAAQHCEALVSHHRGILTYSTSGMSPPSPRRRPRRPRPFTQRLRASRGRPGFGTIGETSRLPVMARLRPPRQTAALLGAATGGLTQTVFTSNGVMPAVTRHPSRHDMLPTRRTGETSAAAGIATATPSERPGGAQRSALRTGTLFSE